MARFKVLLWLLLCSGAWAQQQLVVNGQPVSGLSTAIVRGSSYAPAQTLADALGARYVYDSGAEIALFEWAARLLSVRVFESAAEAANEDSAFALDGAPRPGEGGVLVGGEVYVPVKPIVTLLGGTVSYLESRQTVMAVFPRARVIEAQVSEGGERLVFEIEGLTTTSSFFNRALNTLNLRFDRTDLLVAQSFEGRGFSRAVLLPTAGYVELRLTLEPGYSYETFTSPGPSGFTLVVDVLPAEARNRDLGELRVVLDPGHGGADPGLSFGSGSEAALTLLFAERLASALAAYGVEVSVTRGDADLPLELRRQAGIGSSLFLSIHAGSLQSGQYNLYYLGDLSASTGLTLALRENAASAVAEATDALRRRLLLNLVPDLGLGQSYARALSSQLSQQAGLRAEAVAPAPLAVLEGAAGRGLLLELSPGDLGSETLPEALAAALAALLEEAAD